MIPNNISNLKFIKVLKGTKKAIENEWQLHPLTAEQIMPWIEAGNNYGIICDEKEGIGMIDADHSIYVDLIENFLPKTFSVKSSSDSKRHFYYKITGFPKDKKKISFIHPDSPDDKNKQGGDVRLGKFYVIGPGSIHPETKKPYVVVDDVPIAEISFDAIFSLLAAYFKTPIIAKPKSSSSYKLSIADVCAFYNIPLKSNSTTSVEFFCSHPVHGSEGGTNFGVNISKNAWCCRRHNTGGNVFELVAIMENIISCEQASDGLLPEQVIKVTEIIKEKFGKDFAAFWDRTKDGLRPTYNNVLNYLEEQNLNIHLNEFSDEIEFNGRKFTDRDSLTIKEQLRELHCEPSVKTIDEAIITYAKRHPIHPIREYLSGLAWDGTQRVEMWLTNYAGASDSNYTRFVSTCILVAAVKRVFEPGCQYDYMPILEGLQGIGKSKLVRALGGKWYKEVSMTERDKDTIQKMQGAWFIEVAELAAFAKRDIDSLKAFITVQVDSARFAYGRHDAFYPRQSTFVGTINPEGNGYLLDKTGNRRFLPVLLKDINIDAIIANRDQLFAEAVEIYKSGFKIYMDTAILQFQATQEQELREESDDWSQLIYSWVNSIASSNKLFTTCEIFTECLSGKKDVYNPRTTGRRISNLLKKMGCTDPIIARKDGIMSKLFDLSPLVLDSRNEQEVVITE